MGCGAAAAGMPVETAIAGGTVIYSYNNRQEAYHMREEAKERFDQKVEEEKQYLEHQ